MRPQCRACRSEDHRVLHDRRIEQREYDRHEARRGRRHSFEVLDPHRTALVVVDMVPFFADVPYVRGASAANRPHATRASSVTE